MEWGLAERLGELLQMGRRCSLSTIMSVFHFVSVVWECCVEEQFSLIVGARVFQDWFSHVLWSGYQRPLKG
jgi:hypothetical protein